MRQKSTAQLQLAVPASNHPRAKLLETISEILDLNPTLEEDVWQCLTEDLKNYRDYLIKAGANVQELIDKDMDLQQIIAAEPSKEWDEELGKTWITPAQFVTFIYNSLEGIHHYTPPKTVEAEAK